jgi:RHS repeat-associated protein
LDLSGSQTGAGGIGGLLFGTFNGSSSTSSVAYAFDGNGNVSALLDMKTGQVAAEYEYSPFGETIRATGPLAKENPFRFSTKRTDDTTGLILYEYRILRPDIGRWLSRDLIGLRGGRNLYGFVRNTPIRVIDRLGLKAVLGENGNGTLNAVDPHNYKDDLERFLLLRQQRRETCEGECKSGNWKGTGWILHTQYAVGWVWVWGTYKCVGQENIEWAVYGNDFIWGMAAEVKLAGQQSLQDISGVKFGKALKGKTIYDKMSILKAGGELGVLGFEGEFYADGGSMFSPSKGTPTLDLSGTVVFVNDTVSVNPKSILENSLNLEFSFGFEAGFFTNVRVNAKDAWIRDE